MVKGAIVWNMLFSSADVHQWFSGMSPLYSKDERFASTFYRNVDEVPYSSLTPQYYS
jgi:hypothetical protein